MSQACVNWENGFCSCFEPDDSDQGGAIYYREPRCAVDQKTYSSGDHCPRCGGTILVDGDETKCMMCGEEYGAAPPTIADILRGGPPRRRRSTGSDHGPLE